MDAVDVLVVTHNRPEYTLKTLDRLIESVPASTRLWLWHNGTDEATLSIAYEASERAPNAVFRHCPENAPLRVPLNWVIAEGTAPFAAKIDDDCLVPDGWLQTTTSVLTANPGLGAVAGWHYPESDFDPDLAAHKIRDLEAGYQLMQNPWVQGSGFVISRAWLDQAGPLCEDESWTQYARRLARLGSINGWLLPLILIDHMDDPRSPNTCLRTDHDIVRAAPLSARRNGVTTIEAWQSQLERSARIVLTYPAEDVGGGSVITRLMWRARGRLRRYIKGAPW